MTRRKKLTGVVLACVLFGIIVGYMLIGNPVVFMNNHQLANAIHSISADHVSLNEIVPFEWDTVYTFEPYASKESIEETVGFKSASIKENNINEGMVHLLFIKDKKVVASVLGYGENLGYNINFESKVSFSEKANFDVTVVNGTVILTKE